AQLVLDDKEQPAPVKAQAQAVLGLVLVAEGKPDEAKNALTAAPAALPADALRFREQAELGLKLATNPADYYRGEVARLLRWQGPAALAFLERAADGVKDADRPALKAELALLRLDVVRSRLQEQNR